MQEAGRACAHLADGLATADTIAFADGESFDVGIDGEQAVTVFDHDNRHTVGVIGDSRDGSCISGLHGGSAGGCDVDPFVAARCVGADDITGHGADETCRFGRGGSGRGAGVGG